MGSLLNRYRSLTLLLLLLFLQLILVAYQIRTGQDVRLLRVWAVNSVTPVARVLAAISSGITGTLKEYIFLSGARQENEHLRKELDRLRFENRFLRSELGTAGRAQAMSAFLARTPSKMIAARVIGTGPSADSRVLLVDRGSVAGVRAGMAVVNADGVIGKVTAAFIAASQVLLVTDPGFAAGVISANHRVQGTLRGAGGSLCKVDHIQNEEQVQAGEWFYTSGDDRLFPRGLPAGRVKSTASGRNFKEVILSPSAFAQGLNEVLIVLEGVHQPLPAAAPATSVAPLLPPPPQENPSASAPAFTPVPVQASPAVGTDADRLIEKYRKAAEAQGKPYGGNVPPPKPSVPAPTPAGAAPVKP